MFKKLYALIVSTLVPLAFVGNVSLAESSYRFSENSSIKNDIAQLGLDYSDYKISSDKNYDKTDVIALSESYIDSGSSKQIINYVYVYNPFSLKDDVKSFSLKYNNSVINSNVVSSTRDVLSNIVKYKVDFRMPTYSEYERSYNITSITYSSGKDESVDFKCKFNQDGSNISLDYNSYIFITGKELFSYVPNNPTDDGFDWVSNDKSEWYRLTYGNSFDLIHNCYYAPDLMFLNFDTNKKIDVINEIDLSYKLYQGTTYDCLFFDGNDFYKCIDEIENSKLSDLTLIKDYSTDYCTIYNKNNDFKIDSSEYVNVNVRNNIDMSINNFNLTQNRISKFPILYDSLSSKVLNNSSNNYSAIQSFENRQVSLLVDILPSLYSKWQLGFKANVYKYVIRDLSVMRINYTTDMKVYNARCNSGASISSESANDVPSPSFWDRFIAWFNDNFPYSLLIIGGAVIGLPLIISVVVSLFTTGGSALLSGIGKLLGKMISGFFKLIINILFLPFKLVGAILSPKKKNDKKK